MDINKNNLWQNFPMILDKYPEHSNWLIEQKGVYDNPAASECTKNRTTNMILHMLKSYDDNIIIEPVKTPVHILETINRRLNEEPDFMAKLIDFLNKI